MPVADLCASMMSNASICKWKAKYSGMDLGEARKLRALEDENAITGSASSGMVVSGSVRVWQSENPRAAQACSLINWAHNRSNFGKAARLDWEPCKCRELIRHAIPT